MTELNFNIAEEIFFCGTGAEVVPIVNVDGFAIVDGKPMQLARKLMEVYNNVATGKTQEHPEWRTSV